MNLDLGVGVDIIVRDFNGFGYMFFDGCFVWEICLFILFYLFFLEVVYNSDF